MGETRLTKVNNDIFSRVKDFFRNIFNKNTETLKQSKEVVKKEDANFKQLIQVKEDKEEIRLLKLQEDFANGVIKEEDIREEDTEKLFELYDEQIEEINTKTEMYKQKILEIKAKLNKIV